MDLHMRARRFSVTLHAPQQHAHSLDFIYVGKAAHEELPLFPDPVGHTASNEAGVTTIEKIAWSTELPMRCDVGCKLYGGRSKVASQLGHASAVDPDDCNDGVLSPYDVHRGGAR